MLSANCIPRVARSTLNVQFTKRTSSSFQGTSPVNYFHIEEDHVSKVESIYFHRVIWAAWESMKYSVCRPGLSL